MSFLSSIKNGKKKKKKKEKLKIGLQRELNLFMYFFFLKEATIFNKVKREGKSKTKEEKIVKGRF